MLKTFTKILGILLIGFALFSCEEESFDEINFSTTYSSVDTDSAIFIVQPGSEEIQLSVTVDGKDGLINIYLLSPDSTVSYEETFTGYGSFSSNETIPRESGTWWIFANYESVEGITPSGEFNVCLEY